jgi:hypothetical protein
MVEVEPALVSVEERNEQAGEAADFMVTHLQKLWRASVYDLDRFLHQGIDAGKYNETTALEIRDFWYRKRSRAQEHAEFEGEGTEIPEWEPVQPKTAPVQYISARVQFTEPEPESIDVSERDTLMPNGHDLKGFVVLFAAPGHGFQVGPGKYEADERGEVDEKRAEDIPWLLNAGCRKKR